VSTMWGEGDGAHITVRDQINFPHSLGLFYLALTQYLGFPNYGDEYKVMGLAAYGAPTERANMHKIVRLREKGRFELNLDYFVHHRDGVEMVWDDGRPSVGNVFSNALTDLLGPARAPDEPIENRHRDIAASLQAAYEDAFFHLLDHVSARSQSTNLCIAGGCAMNSVANGKVFERSSFEDIYIQPAAGDAGGAIGAAYSIWSDFSGRKPDFVMDHAYFGPAYDAAEVEAAIEARSGDLAQARCVPERITDPNNLCRRVAERIAAGAVVGWFQGRMEWGPRALGNRSILADPRRSDIRELLNRKIKQRETFRPFAPSILREAVADWFEVDRDVPFMLQVFKLRKDRRELVPAITHVDGTGRLQTVTEAQNPRFYRLIREFGALTGVQMLLNTSFNENEPIVCRPEEALDCFLRTNMDVLVMGDRVLERTVEPSA
jgi:carbamoyltransferase